jgi:hypothetical protein
MAYGKAIYLIPAFQYASSFGLEALGTCVFEAIAVKMLEGVTP